MKVMEGDGLASQLERTHLEQRRQRPYLRKVRADQTRYQATERDICQFWAQRRAADEWKWELGAGSDKCQPGDQITLRELLPCGN